MARGRDDILNFSEENWSYTQGVNDGSIYPLDHLNEANLRDVCLSLSRNDYPQQQKDFNQESFYDDSGISENQKPSGTFSLKSLFLSSVGRPSSNS